MKLSTYGAENVPLVPSLGMTEAVCMYDDSLTLLEDVLVTRLSEENVN